MSINDYAHWGEDAAYVHHQETKWDDFYAGEPNDDPYDDYDDRDEEYDDREAPW